MLPSKGHEANPTELFQAVVQQNVRKWQAPGKRAEKYGVATIREAQTAVCEVLGRLLFNTAAFRISRCFEHKLQHCCFYH